MVSFNTTMVQMIEIFQWLKCLSEKKAGCNLFFNCHW